jgi:putative nucleotidyltransferase with HDIG domain
MPEMDLSLDRLRFNLNTLADLGEEITSDKDFGRVVKSSLLMVMGSFSASKGAIFRYDKGPREGCFTAIADKGLGSMDGVSLRLSASAMAHFAAESGPIDITGDDEGAALLGTARATLERLGFKVVAFLVVKNELLGMVAINERIGGEPHTSYDFQLFSVMAQNISFSLHSHSLLTRLMHKYSENKALYHNLRHVYYDTVLAFATAIDAKDSYTKGHSHRVSAYSSALSREMGWSDIEVEGIRIGGLLHDIGKITVDKTIINKASPLSSNEFRELNSHPVVGYDILSKIKFPWSGIPKMTRSHHERVDGSGYPDRLTGSQISAGAKIVSLVDAFDAMTTDRPYRPRLSFREAMKEISDNFGKQFDPEAVDSFVSIIRKEINGEAESPSIMPLLHEELDPDAVNSILDSFPSLS